VDELETCVPGAPVSPAPVPQSGLTYVLIMPVWEDHHTGLFLRFGIPFLLAASNIGSFPNRSLKVHVMSRRADFERMRQSVVYQQLSKVTDIQETEIDDLIDLSVPHRAMTECYLNAVRMLDRPSETVTIFPTPDCILSRNALSFIRERMEGGWHGVMVCGLRITLETAGPILDEMLERSGAADSIEERELTDLVLKNLHPITMTCSVDSPNFMTSWPSHVYWISPHRDWLEAHCFHLHPIAVRGVPANIDINTTIDGEYLTGLGIDADSLFVCENSDQFICVEISPESKTIGGKFGRFSKKLVVRFSVSCNSLHRQFFIHAIRWRGTRDAQIPTGTLQDISDCVAAVRRGSIFEEWRLASIKFVQKTPSLFFLARMFMLVLRSATRIFMRG
jgi:hypothetical protein